MTSWVTSEWRWLWRETRPFVWYQASALLLILTVSALGLVGPLLMKWLIDDVLPRGRWGGLAVVTALFFGVYAGRALLSSLAGLVNVCGVQRQVLRMRTRLLKHLQSLPAAFHLTHPVGDLAQRLEQDVTVIGEAGATFLPNVIRMIVEIMMTSAAMIFLDWRLSLVVVPLLPIFAYLRNHYREILRTSSEDVRDAAGRQSSLLNEVLVGAVQIQLLGAEHRFGRQYSRLNMATMKKQVSQRKHEMMFSLLTMSIIGLGTALIIGYGGARVIWGDLSAGSLVAFYGYIGHIFHPMQTATELYARLTRVRASVRRLMALEEEPSAIRDAEDAAPLERAPGLLLCTDVGFDYAPDTPTLRGVDVDVRAGERLAIVGESGCGKSSLLKLIPRLYDVRSGRIELDGRDVRSLNLRGLREAVSFVPQDPILFDGTLSQNLRHGCPGATRQDIARAAWIACLTDVVSRLPHGWDTPLGPMGAGLSGGERQRVAIARALLQNRPILILDEATSALDAPTEHRLLSRLEGWCAGRIVMVVSHRLPAARWATRVVVMQRGEIVEDGTHDQLYRPGTHYYALWQRADVNQPRTLGPTAGVLAAIGDGNAQYTGELGEVS